MIPLSIPNISGNEWKYVKDCLDTGWISSAGAYVNKFEEAIQNYTGVKHAIACINGTAGLQISLNLAGVSSNDIVIAPNLTFVATLNAISYTGAEIALIDVCEDSWQMDIDLLQNWLENNTITKIVAEMMNSKFNYVIYNAKYGIKSWIKSNLKTVKP